VLDVHGEHRFGAFSLREVRQPHLPRAIGRGAGLTGWPSRTEGQGGCTAKAVEREREEQLRFRRLLGSRRQAVGEPAAG
jgi:hypothetical protein